MSTKRYIPALSFDFLTKFYDLVISITMPEKKFRKALITEAFAKQTRLKALEFGIGTASNSIMALNQYPNHKITGLDVDPKVLEIAKLKIEKMSVPIEIIQFDGIKSKLSESSFDLVFSALVFHHLDHKRKIIAFEEINRLLKINGRFVFVDWGNPSNLFTSIGFFLLRMFDGWKNTKDNHNGNYLKMIEATGFEKPERIKSFDTVFGTLELMKTKKI